MRSFLILHGLGGSGPAHWQAWLYRELLQRGEKAYFPDFPGKDHPDQAAWLERLNTVFSQIPEGEEIIVVAHSLACINWFHYAISGLSRSVKRVILVTPPSAFLDYEPIKAFFNFPDNKKKAIQRLLKKHC
ncbi:alpha/beta fold hydrolase [Terrilactibacillus sp. S3-3]|nr:alpha/beta fold hydrolase [Terrilactibacillus sp. S3-3]